MAIEARRDQKRGCGWRKPGGLYLVSDGLAMPCGKLPVPLDVCPTCHAGFKPSRGWTWVDGDALLGKAVCFEDRSDCAHCPLSRNLGTVGLLWVGGSFYKQPEDWTREARTLGVSRRISALPRNFQLGKTWVLVAHREAIKVGPDEFKAAVFHAFKPQAVEYVVRGNETAEKFASMEKRGITLIRIERVEEHETPLLAEALA